MNKFSCNICSKNLKLIESITNKCSYCNLIFCGNHKLPFKQTINISGHFCEEYNKSLKEKQENDIKMMFKKNKMESFNK